MNLNIAMLKTLSPMRSLKITKQSVAKALKRVVQFEVMGKEDVTNEKLSRFQSEHGLKSYWLEPESKNGLSCPKVMKRLWLPW